MDQNAAVSGGCEDITSFIYMPFEGDCGTKPADQWQIRATLKEQFPQKAWVDVFSKADLLQALFSEAASEGPSQGFQQVIVCLKKSNLKHTLTDICTAEDAAG